MRSSFTQAWYNGCDAGVRRVAGKANGHLFHQLLVAAKYCDPECVFMLREGADVLGELVCSGIGKPIISDSCKSTEKLRADKATWNARLLKELKEDKLSEKLMQITLKDARLGRMSWPKRIDEEVLNECLMCPRFGVEQVKPDGRSKVRAVDNFSWSPASTCSKAEQKALSVNGESIFNVHCARDTFSSHLARPCDSVGEAQA